MKRSELVSKIHPKFGGSNKPSHHASISYFKNIIFQNKEVKIILIRLKGKGFLNHVNIMKNNNDMYSYISGKRLSYLGGYYFRKI